MSAFSAEETLDLFRSIINTTFGLRWCCIDPSNAPRYSGPSCSLVYTSLDFFPTDRCLHTYQTSIRHYRSLLRNRSWILSELTRPSTQHRTMAEHQQVLWDLDISYTDRENDKNTGWQDRKAVIRERSQGRGDYAL